MKILITGASGYIGQHLCQHLVAQGHTLYPVVRAPGKKLTDIPITQHHFISDYIDREDYSELFQGIDIYIHLLGHNHQPNEPKNQHAANCQKLHVACFKKLVTACCLNHVKQIIFFSSIHVHGLESKQHPFHPNDKPEPSCIYGQSKWQAEQLLQRATANTPTDYTIIRPPLVYGSNPKGNLHRLKKWVQSGYPVPLAGILHNKRHLVSLDHLVNFTSHCLFNQRAFNKTFLVADKDPVSTADIVENYRNHKSTLVKVPPWLIHMLFNVTNRRLLGKKLLGNLEIDINPLREQLDWEPMPSLLNTIKD